MYPHVSVVFIDESRPLSRCCLPNSISDPSGSLRIASQIDVKSTVNNADQPDANESSNSLAID